MKLTELKQILSSKPQANVRFHLPNGEYVPAHAHVTEVARIDKRFVDCGGTFREESICRLQTWVHDDVDHRLTAGKLFKILEKANPVLGTDDIGVDIEHELEFISQFALESIDASSEEVVLRLTTKHTACLAMDQCCPATPISPLQQFKPLTFNAAR